MSGLCHTETAQAARKKRAIDKYSGFFCTKISFWIFIVQRQSKLDEVTGRTGEADGLGGIPATQPSLTTPLERRDIPPQLSMTLEHIVGQLDVLTQVGRGNISEQGIICRNQEPWVWGGDAHLLMTPSRIGEYTKG